MNLNNIKYFLLGISSITLIIFLHTYWFQVINEIKQINIVVFGLYTSIVASAMVLIFHKITTHYPETSKGLKYISYIVFIILLIIYLIFTKSTKDYQTSVALMISTLFLGIGWWVQAIVTQTIQRRSHTITILTNQRNNPDFIEKVNKCRNILGTKKVVNQEFIKYFIDKSSIQLKSGLSNDKKQEFNEILDAIACLNYLLNYYEFIAAGVNIKDLDEELIKKFLYPMFLNIEKRSYYLICLSIESHNYQSTEDFAYKELITFINKISKNSSLINNFIYEKKMHSFESTELVFSDEQINEFFEI